jgi:hypothetical protein
MFKSVKLNAEEQFAATQKKAIKAREEKEKVQQEEAEHIAKLRALRLSKEAAEKKEAAIVAAEKLASKNEKELRSA